MDGSCTIYQTIPFSYKNAVVSRIKIMSDLDIAERRLPQDGRIPLRVQGKELDLRVSTIPTSHGESVVMRILDRENIVLDFDALGFDDTLQKQFTEALELPHGIILVTGPTGSGKTTTLYSALGRLNTVDVNIMTAEDPVEFDRVPARLVNLKSNLVST